MRRFVLFLLFLLGLPSVAAAHPHAFIDLQTTLVLDGQGRLTAIREHWLFDQYYTEFALHDFAYGKNGVLDRDKLMELARENLKNLKDFSYFTYFPDPKPQLGTAGDIDSSLQDGRIALDFTLKLASPLAPPLSFRIYDPSYYTAMLHVESKPLVVQGGSPTCHATLVKPKPSAAWSNLAKALDKNATAPDDLGTYFAEKVSLTCSQKNS